MSSHKSHLGLLGYHSVEFYVHDLERSVAWHKAQFDFPEIARTTPEFERRHGVTSIVLKGPGGAGWIFTKPLEKKSTAGRYLDHHPEGIGFLNFRVGNMAKAVEYMAERKAPFLYDIVHQTSKSGNWHEVAIATPISEVGFRFVEDDKFGDFAPGFKYTADPATVGGNRYGFDDVDHVTVNLRCMVGFTEFTRECMGFERYWGVEFHTSGRFSAGSLSGEPGARAPEKSTTAATPGAGAHGTGSGLESIVMWDPGSGVKFATNQPLAPYFNNSQIQIYIEDNRGAGIQHLALRTPDIIPTIASLREKGAKFLKTGAKYYEQLPRRIEQKHIGTIKEPMDRIRDLGILVDGADHKYLLQLFMSEMKDQMGVPEAGPFFYEVIQRAGDPGFGDGNFKALFDSIEQGQVAAQRQEMRDRVDTLV